jgi:hypothetical protein
MFAKIKHFFHREECLKNSFWFYGVLFCGECKRHIAYETYIDGQKKLVINKPYLAFLKLKKARFKLKKLHSKYYKKI